MKKLQREWRDSLGEGGVESENDSISSAYKWRMQENNQFSETEANREYHAKL